jgi:hypothetical protein
MIDDYESLNKRVPILDVVIKHLSCNDAERKLVQELFVTVYGVGYSDGLVEGITRPASYLL